MWKECWPIKKSQIQGMGATKIRMIRWMCDHAGLDRIRNAMIRDKVAVAPIEDKKREARLRWFGHI